MRAGSPGEALGLGGLQFPGSDHLLQHEVAAADGLLRVVEGAVGVRRLQQPGEQGALLHLQVRGFLVEVQARRRLQPVGVVAEEHGVEVHHQDLALGVEPLHVDGRDLLADLAGVGGQHVPQGVGGALGADLPVEVAGQLLGEGAGPLGGGVPALHVLQDGPEDAAQVDPPMAEEAAVLHRDQGVPHRLGDLFEAADQLPVLELEVVEVAAVRGVDPGDPLGLEGLQLVDVREVVADQGVDHAQDQRVEAQAGEGVRGDSPGGQG